MWIDQMRPVKLTSGTQHVSTGKVKVIQNIDSMSTVKALTLSGVVYGNGNEYMTATAINMMPGERWEGDFVKIDCVTGMIICHDLPDGDLNL